MDFGTLPNGRANAPDTSNTLLLLAGNLSPGLSSALMLQASPQHIERLVASRIPNSKDCRRSGLAPKTGLRL